MKINKLQKLLFLVVVIFMTTCGVFAQSDVSSPYSRFGLGTINPSKTNTIMQGMGGICNAMDGKHLLNNSNPASYAEIDSLTFLFDAGFFMKYVTYRTADASEKGSNASFDYFDVGFGVTKWLKMGLGVGPYSSRAYTSRADFTTLPDHPYSIDYEGDGGLNRIYWANGFKVSKSLSLGFNMNYIFGNIIDATTLYFPNDVYFHNERRVSNLRFTSLTFDLGMIFKHEFGNDYKFAFGATYSLPTNMTAHRDVFIRTMLKGYGNLTENPIDTILYKKGESTPVKYPQSIGTGITLQKGERWLIGIDFNWSNWSAFRINHVSDSLQNSWNIAIGGSYTPYSTSVSSYFTKLTYRAGIHYDQTYFNIYGTSINKYGVTLGLGLPVPRAMTSINLAFEFGKMGTTQNNLIEETYFNISIGLSMHDKWFVKRRYK